jgi:putative tricarboxylic transport membrane protein
MNRISGIITALLGAAMLWRGMLLRVGSLRHPGPGFFPCILALVLLVLSLFLMIPGTKKKGRPAFSWSSLKKVGLVYGLLLGYFVTLESLGFALSGFFLMMFLFVFIDRQRIRAAALTSVIFMVLAYLIFNVLLRSELPRGVLGI